MVAAFPALRAAAVDGRAHNIHYRQVQLERLFNALVGNVDALRDAIVADYGFMQAEAAVEYNLAVAAVRRDYASLQPEHAHEEEYSIANGRDAGSARKPVGIVVIEPTVHSLLYSVVVPLSAAIAAGNCVIVTVRSVVDRTTPALLMLSLIQSDAADE